MLCPPKFGRSGPHPDIQSSVPHVPMGVLREVHLYVRASQSDAIDTWCGAESGRRGTNLDGSLHKKIRTGAIDQFHNVEASTSR